MNFQQKLDIRMEKVNSLVCVGLDADYKKISAQEKTRELSQFAFNRAIIDETHPFVCAYKPNSAFYEAGGAEGIEELKKTCDYIHKQHPDIPIILDAKRADIGNTNEGYVTFAFDYLGADAITLHPYLGYEALKPFLDRSDCGCIILCKTSNPGAGEFQDLNVDGKPLYQIIAEQVIHKWNINGNCLLVVGATYPKELAEVRAIVGDMTLLVPGIGTQGGDVDKTVRAGVNSFCKGMIISSARNIIFASSGADFAKQAGIQARKLHDEINIYRK